MARPGKPSLFDRKLQDLEQQRDLIQNDIRSLSKSLRKIEEGGELPPLRSRQPEPRTPARAPQPAAPIATAPPAEPLPAAREPSAPKTSERTFARLAPLETEPEAAASSPGSDRSLDPLVVDTRRLTPLKTPKFANYLASGSFGNSRPLAQERRIQRNKAVFMVVVLVLALVVVLRFVF